MERRLPPREFPVVVLDAMHDVQLSVVTATTDLHHLETSHGNMLDKDQRTLLHGWYEQLDRLSKEIGGILGG